MSRAAVFDAILANASLVALGLDTDSLLVNYDGEQRPNDHMFIVLGWGTDDTGMRGDDVFHRELKNLTIWVHIYREDSTDYGRIDAILDTLDGILLNMIHTAGSDGNTVSMVEFAGRSRDMKDDSYQTICRSTSYRILSRVTVPV